MADVITPVKPPAAVMPSMAIAPMNAAALVAPSKSDRDAFEMAVESGDGKTLRALTASTDPDVSRAAKTKVEIIDRHKPFADALAKIDPATTQGHIDIAKTYQTLNDRDEAKAKGWSTIADSPQLGTALLRFVMGDKTGAMRQITGGDIKQETEYDDAGKMLIVNKNELGEIDSVFEANGKMISRKEYDARGGSRELEKTLFREQQKAFQKEYIAKYITDSENQLKSAGALGAAAGYSKEMADLAGGFKDLDPKTAEMLASFNASTLNFGTSVSSTIQDLESASSTKGKSLNSDKIKEIENKTGTVLGTVFTHVEGDTFKNAAGETASASSLAQKMKSSASGKTLERTVSQAKDDVAKQIRIAQTEGAPPERIKQLQNMERYFDLAGMREKIYLDNKEKMPSFVQLPTQLPKITDQAARLKLNALQGEYAAAQMNAFIKWKDEQLQKERSVNKSFVPEPGRYEAQWVKQKEYGELEDAFRARARNTLNETPVLAKPVDQATLPSGPVTAQQAGGTNRTEPVAPPAQDRSSQFKVIPNEVKAPKNDGFKVRRPKK
jgi:hypothetical protein